ncbi:MAG: glycosyltransferase [Spirochaetales bacterium]|nr:glycosyltransferase [Spirochaetales bacterium]
MRVAFFSEAWEPQINGVVTSSQALASTLVAPRDSVYVFAPRYPGFRDTGANVFRQPAIRYFFQPEFYFSNPLPFAALKAARRWRIDLVHMHSEFTLGLVAGSVARRLGVPSVLTLHTLWEYYGHYFMWGLVPRPLFRYFLSLLYRLPDYFIAPSIKAKDYLSNVIGVTQPIAVIPTGINLSMFRNARLPAEERTRRRARYGIGPDDTVIMFAGRVGKEKSISVLIDGVAALRRRHPDLKLMIVGSGPFLEHYRRYAARLGLEREVVFTGYLPYTEMPFMYRLADAFAIASVSETQGLVTVEALASGLPVVARDDPANNDMVGNGAYGLIFKRDTDFPAVLDRLLAQPDLAARLRAAAADGSARFNVAHYGKSVREYYKWIVGDFKARKR